MTCLASRVRGGKNSLVCFLVFTLMLSLVLSATPALGGQFASTEAFDAFSQDTDNTQGKRIKFRKFFVARRCLSLPDFSCSLSRISGALPGTGNSWRCAV